jgi:hypothetical protein
MKKIRGYSSVRELGKWVKYELKHRSGDGEYRKNDNVFLIQVLTTEFDRMEKALLKKWITIGDIKLLISKPAKTGHKEWDALFEGIVQFYCNVRFKINYPKWTVKTKLKIQFDPFFKMTKNDENYFLELFLDTPQELFQKNIIMPKVAFNHI